MLFLLTLPAANAYSVLTHEAIVDSLWLDTMRPLLMARFPQATSDQINEAHGYAYGGCIIQDLGYYPFGSHFFSDLTHYVRSANFVQALVEESQDLDEYAFALGAVAHYGDDVDGLRSQSIAQCRCFIRICARNLATKSLTLITQPRI